ANAIELGFASRAFKTDGTEDFGADDVYGTFCRDAVVVVVSEENTGVTNLTQDQVAAIFKGEVTDWSEIN
ncbi:MAG: substrate-binding domain-containing protein, partial [Bacillota bacterium]|nr:substrate-binding domain-containing protein [Bacillota bacterium]